MIGDPLLFLERAEAFRPALKPTLFAASDAPKPSAAGELCVYPVALEASVVAGELNVKNSTYVLETLRIAVARRTGSHLGWHSDRPCTQRHHQ